MPLDAGEQQIYEELYGDPAPETLLEQAPVPEEHVAQSLAAVVEQERDADVVELRKTIEELRTENANLKDENEALKR